MTKSYESMNPEHVAHWFFRLNGCLTISNFVVHPDAPGPQRTDVDILGVRFPYRSEIAGPEGPLEDHMVFRDRKKIGLVIAEIKTGKCKLNGPWTEPEKGNLPRVLSSVGTFRDNEINEAANSLYDDLYYENSEVVVRLFALGSQINTSLHRNVVQITWPEVSEFFFNRFSKHGIYKSQHQQWDQCGKMIFNLWEHSGTRGVFTERLFVQMRLKRL
jgi:hypothetical protein